MSRFISIDPGHKKCGLLLADIVSGNVLEGHIVESDSVLQLINTWNSQNTIEKILLGNGTSSKLWELKLLENNFKYITLVEEKGTTLRSRERYWELWPPRSFMKFIPPGILLPPENLDSIAALILLEDYLNKKLNWSNKPSFKTWPE